MKLLKAGACHPAPDGGNAKRMTVMGDARMDRLSDAGSIPARSICKVPYLRHFLHFVLHFVLHSLKVTVYYFSKFLLFIGNNIPVYRF